MPNLGHTEWKTTGETIWCNDGPCMHKLLLGLADDPLPGGEKRWVPFRLTHEEPEKAGMLETRRSRERDRKAKDPRLGTWVPCDVITITKKTGAFKCFEITIVTKEMPGFPSKRLMGLYDPRDHAGGMHVMRRVTDSSSKDEPEQQETG